MNTILIAPRQEQKVKEKQKKLIRRAEEPASAPCKV